MYTDMKEYTLLSNPSITVTIPERMYVSSSRIVYDLEKNQEKTLHHNSAFLEKNPRIRDAAKQYLDSFGREDVLIRRDLLFLHLCNYVLSKNRFEKGRSQTSQMGIIRVMMNLEQRLADFSQDL